MKSIFTLLAVLAVLPAVSLSIDPAAPEWELFHGRNGSFSTAELEGRKSLRLEWNGTRGEFFFRKPPPLPDFRRAEFSVSVYLPEKGPRRVNLRLVDREGEIFQLTQSVKFEAGKSAWRTCVFTFDTTAAEKLESWGRKCNHRPDFPLALHGICLSGNPEPGGWCGLSTVGVRIVDRAPEIRFDAGTPFGMLPADENFRPRLEILNPQDAEKQIRLTYRVVDSDGHERESRERVVTLSARSSFVEEIARPVRFGVHRLSVAVVEKDGRETHSSFRFLLPLPSGGGNDSGFLFGVHAHIKDRPEAEQRIMAAAAEACGIGVIRETATWAQMQPSADLWSFRKFDRLVALLNRHHLQWLPVLCFNVPWATASDWKPVAPDLNKAFSRRPDYQAWEVYVRKFLERYGKQIPFVEVWNEPDLLHFANFSLEEYITLLKLVYSEVRSSAPQVRVTTGGFAAPQVPAKVSPDPEYVRNFLRLAGGNYDIFNIHIHGPFDSYRKGIRLLEEMRASCNDKTPWYSGETGISSSKGVSEEMQAVVLFQKLVFAWSRGAIGYNWYNLVEKKQFPEGSSERHYGLLTPDFQPKPAYAAYHALIANFRGASYVDALQDTSDVELLLFRKGQQRLLAGWVNGTAHRVILLEGLAGAVESCDLWGNADALPAQEGVTGWILKQAPQTLRWSGRTKPVIAGVFPEFSGAVILLPGRKSRVSFGTLSNHSGQARRYSVSLEGNPQLEGIPEKRSIPLAPGAREEVAAELILSEEPTDSEIRLRLGLEGKTEWVIPIRVQAARQIPAAGDHATLDFELTEEKLFTSLIPPVPENSHLFRTGPEDLSARGRLSRDNDALFLRVEVRDDHHVTVAEQKNYWEGDSIQFRFKLPEQSRAWEIGVDGDRISVGGLPSGFSRDEVMKLLTGTVRRDATGHETVYELKIPFRAVGLDLERGRQGFRMNLQVNDNDGTCRKGFLSLGNDQESWLPVCF